ncbi:aspartate oxidase [Porphyromonas crevioricanis]|uniref:L-aspartate oxidase n=1 Tax=Porphyromonas crevioricanis TaxID=393921 RepID=UPI00052E3DAF|nr:L-aspartate oxidase [Porphyromonas crevioricanis]KGN89987.1 aspartate oxidase [Porphyromonas crevioricanis]
MKVFDYMVVGAGLAGLYTAYRLSRKGRVALIARASLEDSNSYYAQGGMAAVVDVGDTPYEHYRDTIEAGRGLCKPEAVRMLAEEAPERIEELISLGMAFDTESPGHLALGLEGGHHHKRILHAGGDATGRLVTTFMIGEVHRSKQIEIFDHHFVAELIIRSAHCIGCWVYREGDCSPEAFYASAVVLATGGAAALYRPTTNPPTTLGDGLALALYAGASLADMEFVQFHPTALYLPDKPSFLISEAVRGEGAYLLNKEGKRFMLEKHPLAELAPRDIVARSIFRQMEQDKTPCVTLSLNHLDPNLIRSRFPSIAQHCKDVGLDITQQIPVAPAAHYTVGGIVVDPDGATSVSNLYAVGEVASTGVMGANRLASNSLVECLVFGRRITDAITSLAKTLPRDLGTDKPSFSVASPQVEEHWQTRQGATLMSALGNLLMCHVGIIRDETSLKKAIVQIEEQMQLIEPDTSNLLSARMIYHRHRIALSIAQAALERKESRGGHYRSDYPTTLPLEQTYRSIINQTTISQVAVNYATE